MQHALENHPQKQKAIDLILSGASVRNIAAQLDPPVSFQAVQRYRRAVIRPVAANAETIARLLGKTKGIQDNGIAREPIADAMTALQAAQVADPCLAHVAKGNARRERWMAKAEEAKDFRACAAHDRNDLSALELYARLTGRLDAPGATQNNYYIMAGSISMRGPEAAAERPAIDVTPVSGKPESDV